jgi:hypothetical protein
VRDTDTHRDTETERQREFEEREERREKWLTRREERRVSHRHREGEWLKGKTTTIPTTVTEQEIDEEEEGEEGGERENIDEDGQETQYIVIFYFL